MTAGMGAGHDKVAVELSRRLCERGTDTVVLDIWELLPFGLGRWITGLLQVHHPAGAVGL
jgi:hypothetical protein